jgi:hypothetical protein
MSELIQQSKEFREKFMLALSQMKVAIFNKKNPHFKSNYADLSSVITAISDALSKNGFYYYHSIINKESFSELITKIVYAELGEYVQSCFYIPQSVKAQEFGSYITYGKRYNLSCLTSIISDEDDDGNIASKLEPKLQNKKDYSYKDLVKLGHVVASEGDEELSKWIKNLKRHEKDYLLSSGEGKILREIANKVDEEDDFDDDF